MLTLRVRYYMLLKSDSWQQGAQDPKAFSKTILTNIINDEDKYQIGLTKIFLRAGMLAYLESRRLDRLNTLATVIQKNFKRTMQRRKYLRLRESSIRVQTWWRGVMARKMLLDLKKDAAVSRLQRAARMFIQRSRFVAVHNAVTGLQAGNDHSPHVWTVTHPFHQLSEVFRPAEISATNDSIMPPYGCNRCYVACE
jgi:myosin V